jgi:hypothetical protein
VYYVEIYRIFIFTSTRTKLMVNYIFWDPYMIFFCYWLYTLQSFCSEVVYLTSHTFFRASLSRFNTSFLSIHHGVQSITSQLFHPVLSYKLIYVCIMVYIVFVNTDLWLYRLTKFVVLPTYLSVMVKSLHDLIKTH